MLKTKIIMDVNNVYMNKYQYFMSFFMLGYLIFWKLSALFYMKKLTKNN
jgi:hypothetical protein